MLGVPRTVWVTVGLFAAAAAVFLWLWPGASLDHTAKPAVALAQSARRAPAPFFSPRYTATVQAATRLSAEQADLLEQQLLLRPEDQDARLELLAYDTLAVRLRPELRERHARNTLWLIEHHPDSEALQSPYAAVAPGQITADEFRHGAALFDRACALPNVSARTLGNAARFFRGWDRAKYEQYLSRAAAADPNIEMFGRDLGIFYAEALVAMTKPDLARDAALAARARANLDTTPNPYTVEAATRLLQSEYNKSTMLGRENREARDLAQRYFARAEALDPDLDRAWVLPPPPPPAEPRSLPSEVRRLEPDAFAELPPAVVSELRRRGCQIPQPPASAPVNVIRGEFFAAGSRDWAVLCSARRSVSVLVFPEGSAAGVRELAAFAEDTHIQDFGRGVMEYSRGITPVGRDYILEHYQAHGGPAPPPIDHQGINDAFLEKASVVHYFYQGKWLGLTGAD
jgi:hypothetical protein